MMGFFNITGVLAVLALILSGQIFLPALLVLALINANALSKI